MRQWRDNDKFGIPVSGDYEGCSKVASKPLVMRKFNGFLPKAATTLERPRAIMVFAFWGAADIY
jgi:hypothetical protein